jgi:hypothetical protein
MMVFWVDGDFLKIGRIIATFLKIVRIIQNQDVLGYNLRSECVARNKNAHHPQFSKIRTIFRKVAGIRANFRKSVFQENPLNTASTRIAFYVSI